MDHSTELSLILKSSGLRVTKSRLCVLDLLITASEAMSHQHVEEYLHSKGIYLDTVTIYRTLNSLTEAGVIHKITGVDRSYQYAFAKTSQVDKHHTANHPHFTCQKCTHTYCLPDMPTPTEIKAPVGFELIHAEITLVGYCPECA